MSEYCVHEKGFCYILLHGDVRLFKWWRGAGVAALKNTYIFWGGGITCTISHV